ncbi:M23 family metallopeptidase [Staphylospora marina]|uniref:M23 family metallopeptidase n=1 Tax=Staphylospora marina TaxID=2490858 RepID=UPI0013DDB4DE|nr:M23 family metallopeptidase [Staphylospora marina]
MTRHWSENNKRRRREKIRRIREGIPIPADGGWTLDVAGSGDQVPWNRSQPGSGRSVANRLLKQGVGAATLFVLTLMLFSSSSPALQPMEAFVREVMTRDFNFAGAGQWVKRVTGGAEGILPAFRPSKESSGAKISWSAPAKGSVALPFDNKRKGVVIRIHSGNRVETAAEGWVVFSGVKEGLGNTVIVRHAGGTETWYGWLENTPVRENDWVKAGQSIGQAKETGGQTLLYFAVKKDGNFINPTSVISFE